MGAPVLRSYRVRVDGAATIVARTLRRIGDEDFAFLWSGIPENFGDVPGAIAIVYQQAVTEMLEGGMSANDRHRRRGRCKNARACVYTGVPRKLLAVA